ncbi:lysozyme family protein [Pseudophaeobacter flagellatus]|uniref:hypothetical protein n=1 Tax=Pseudophaeobacter flagellatus TaxID=2899119 RepID=UPI001E497127|nr:hypothetical protein [Pseudophaeobacter flagellatus]MCD9148549.1 hypothetical protein [Pseudophaeobacter flagellatus]
MSKSQLGPRLISLSLALFLSPASFSAVGATEQFSIVNEGFFRQGSTTAAQPMLARHSPASVLAGEVALGQDHLQGQELEAEMEAVQANLASLFADRRGTSLFRAMPQNGSARGAVAKLMQLIASAEAGSAQYDAVQHAAKVRPQKQPTQLTLGEIYDWIARTPGQQHAIGRYQFIPATLKRLARQIGAERGEVFSPALQDRLAHQLLEEAGLSAVMARKMDRRDFMHNLSKIWAGLPTSTGKSYYHGLAGNRAVLSWARFDAEMARIFPS